jgi:hypothetical protein
MQLVNILLFIIQIPVYVLAIALKLAKYLLYLPLNILELIYCFFKLYKAIFKREYASESQTEAR